MCRARENRENRKNPRAELRCREGAGAGRGWVQGRVWKGMYLRTDIPLSASPTTTAADCRLPIEFMRSVCHLACVLRPVSCVLAPFILSLGGGQFFKIILRSSFFVFCWLNSPQSKLKRDWINRGEAGKMVGKWKWMILWLISEIITKLGKHLKRKDNLHLQECLLIF